MVVHELSMDAKNVAPITYSHVSKGMALSSRLARFALAAMAKQAIPKAR